MLSGSLNAEVGQATPQLLQFRSRPPYLVEEIAYPTSIEPSRWIEKTLYYFL
jgi:hypothetical protein